MNSPTPKLSGKQGHVLLDELPIVSQAFCKVRRCTELRPLNRVLCDRHDAMAPAYLVDVIARVAKTLEAAAKDGDIGRGMRALESGLMAERQICIAIEKMEAAHVAS